MADAIQVVTTTGTREEADNIARQLVTRKLAACVQVAGPISSTYSWQGKVETSQEWLCLIKSREALFSALEAAICELHSYDVPEILAFRAMGGHAPYLEWMQQVLGGETH